MARLDIKSFRHAAQGNGLKTGATLIAASLLASPINAAFASSAHASETKATTNSPAPYNFTVPFMDTRGQDQRVVGFSAAQVSTTGIALVLYGDDQGMYKAANRAVQDAREHSKVAAGLVIADYHPALRGQHGVAVYIGGERALYGKDGAPIPISSENLRQSHYYTSALRVGLETYQKGIAKREVDAPDAN